MVLEVRTSDTIFTKDKPSNPLYVYDVVNGEIMHCKDAANLEHIVLKRDIHTVIHKQWRK